MFGDIIYVQRNPIIFGSTKERENEDSRLIDKMIFRMVPYRHYGIEVENGYVIHFHSSSYRKRKLSRVKKVTLETFLLGGGTARTLPIIGERLTRQETVARAYASLGEATMVYSINKNNCEHFAYYCATGNYHSAQTHLLSKGQDVLMLPTKVVPLTRNKIVPMTVRTKNRTVKFSIELYKKILRKA